MALFLVVANAACEVEGTIAGNDDSYCFSSEWFDYAGILAAGIDENYQPINTTTTFNTSTPQIVYIFTVPPLY